MDRAQRMELILARELAPSHMELRNDSGKHAGHAGAGADTHYALTIAADCLSGLSKVQQHQTIYAVLNEEFQSGLHALSITVLSRKP